MSKLEALSKFSYRLTKAKVKCDYTGTQVVMNRKSSKDFRWHEKLMSKFFFYFNPFMVMCNLLNDHNSDNWS